VTDRDDQSAFADQDGRPTPSDDRFRFLVDSVNDYAIFWLDPEGHVASWNQGAQRIKGYTANEIVGRHFSTFYLPHDLASNKPARELAIAVADGRFEDEGWRVRKDGSLFWANVVITALRDAHGVLVGFAKVTRDLTERRAAEDREIVHAHRLATEEAARAAAEDRGRELASLLEQVQMQAIELEQQNEEAQVLTEEIEQTNEQLHRALEAADEANRVKMEFLATMSHELRTPLNAITGYTQLLDLGVYGPLTDEQRHALGRIRASGHVLLGLINDVLNYARLDAGKVEFALATVQLLPIAEDVVALMAPLAGARGITLSIDGASGSPEHQDPLARTDPEKLRQILINLLSNAVKFTPAGGSVTVAAGREGRYATIVVRDTGIGIPNDKLERVFEPFVQLGRSLTSSAEGAGLGLAISRDLARAMGGDLLVESREGVGSTFTLLAPGA
jgi:PAS domain S-box-containing protein